MIGRLAAQEMIADDRLLQKPQSGCLHKLPELRFLFAPLSFLMLILENSATPTKIVYLNSTHLNMIVGCMFWFSIIQ